MPLHPADWWRSRLRDVTSTYGRDSAMFALCADWARADGYESPKKLSGGARKHPARPARDALIVASKRSNKDLAAWWRKVVGRLFIGIAAEDARSLVITRQPRRTDLAAAYREWLRVVSESIQGVWVGDYKDAPRLERAKRRDGKWTGKYWLLVPKGHQAANDDAALREMMIDVAEELPDWTMTSRDVRKVRRRKASA